MIGLARRTAWTIAGLGAAVLGAVAGLTAIIGAVCVAITFGIGPL